MELFHLSSAAPDGWWSEPGSTSSHLEAAPTPAEFEGTGPVLNLSGRHGMLCLDKHCSKQRKVVSILSTWILLVPAICNYPEQ